MSEQTLSQNTIDICRAHVREALQGDYDIRVESTSSDWDRVQFRNVYQRSMTIWRPYGRFDVILDDATGSVVGFVDYDKLAPSGGVALTRGEVAAIVGAHSVLPEGSALLDLEVHYPAAGIRAYRATFALEQMLGRYSRFEVVVHPERRAIISMRPMERAGLDHD